MKLIRKIASLAAAAAVLGSVVTALPASAADDKVITFNSDNAVAIETTSTESKKARLARDNGWYNIGSNEYWLVDFRGGDTFYIEAKSSTRTNLCAYDTVTLTATAESWAPTVKMYIGGTEAATINVSQNGWPSAQNNWAECSANFAAAAVKGDVVKFVVQGDASTNKKLHIKSIKFSSSENINYGSCVTDKNAGTAVFNLGTNSVTSECTEFVAATETAGAYFANKVNSQNSISAQYGTTGISAKDYNQVKISTRSAGGQTVEIKVGDTVVATGTAPSNNGGNDWYKGNFVDLVMPITNTTATGVVTVEVTASGWSGHYSTVTFLKGNKATHGTLTLEQGTQTYTDAQIYTVDFTAASGAAYTTAKWVITDTNDKKAEAAATIPNISSAEGDTEGSTIKFGVVLYNLGEHTIKDVHLTLQ